MRVEYKWNQSVELDVENCCSPWYSLRLYAEAGGMCSPCCKYCPPNSAFPSPLMDAESIKTAWNCQGMRQVRREIGGGGPYSDICENQCNHTGFFLRDGVEYEELFRKGMLTLSHTQKENAKLAFTEYHQRKEFMTSLPLHYYIRLGWMCNSRCIMCNNLEMRQAFPEKLGFDWLVAQEKYFEKALRVTLIGGDPIVDDEHVRFVKWLLNTPSLENLAITVTTNGQQLDCFSDEELSRFASLVISLDSYGEYYDRIRVGCSWERVSENIDRYYSAKRNFGNYSPLFEYPLWLVCTVTQTGLPGLPEMTKWVAKRRYPIFFSNVYPLWKREVMHESLEGDLDRLEREGIWEDALTQCIATLEGQEMYASSREQLDAIREGVRRKFAQRT